MLPLAALKAPIANDLSRSRRPVVFGTSVSPDAVVETTASCLLFAKLNLSNSLWPFNQNFHYGPAGFPTAYTRWLCSALSLTMFNLDSAALRWEALSPTLLSGPVAA
jgi:hypothetical protein